MFWFHTAGAQVLDSGGEEEESDKYIILISLHIYFRCCYSIACANCVVIDLFIVINEDDDDDSLFLFVLFGQQKWYQLSRMYARVLVCLFWKLRNWHVTEREREKFMIWLYGSWWASASACVCVIVPHKEHVSTTFSRFIGHRHRKLRKRIDDGGCMCVYEWTTEPARDGRK